MADETSLSTTAMKTSWYQFILQHADFITMGDAAS